MTRHLPRRSSSGLLLAALAGACSLAQETAIPSATDSVVSEALPREKAAASGVRDTSRASDTTDRIQPGALRTVAAAPASKWLGPGGKPFEVEIRTNDPSAANNRPFGTITLHNSARFRSPGLGSYPCSSCHLGKSLVLKDERIKDAHQNIKAVHPAQVGAVCATCHAAENVEFLALKNGERVTLDHAYRVCAQCHFSQAESWAGGAHGKRLDGWQGRRVVMGCADCHDPHNPALAQRIPFRAPVLERPPFRRP